MRIFLILAGVAIALAISLPLWLEEGEVVTLITTDASGNEYETGLWVVDLDGVAYLRASSTEAAWIDRLRARPDVELQRGGRRSDYRAIPIGAAEIREAVDGAMAEKYGRLDRVVSQLRRDADSVVVELRPQPRARISERRDGAPGVSP